MISKDKIVPVRVESGFGEDVIALAAAIRFKLVELGDAKIKEQAQRYFRGVISFHGIKTPALDSIYREFAPQMSQLTTPERLNLARMLLGSWQAEEKGIAVRILYSIRKELGIDFLRQFESDFREHVFDWGTADSLAGKVFRHLIESGDRKVILQIVSWRNDASSWMQRMSAVSFVWLARHGHVTPEVLRVCKSTVKNPDRFTQLGTGWVLRELWLAEPRRVEGFIKEHYQHFSREGLRYAIEKMPPRLRSSFLNHQV